MLNYATKAMNKVKEKLKQKSYGFLKSKLQNIKKNQSQFLKYIFVEFRFTASTRKYTRPRVCELSLLSVISSDAAKGRGEASPYGWTSKNYVICVCFHCHGTSSYHTTNTLQGRQAKSHVNTQTIQPGLGDFVL